MVFPLFMYGCESWTVKKAERWRIDAFELLFWRRLLRVPWTARRSNQSILMEISPGCSLEVLMLKLKFQYFGHLMRRVDSLEKNPHAGKDWQQEEKRMTEDEMFGFHHRLDGHEFGWTPGVGGGQGGLVCCNSWGGKELDRTERLNWTELNLQNLGYHWAHPGKWGKGQKQSINPLPLAVLRNPALIISIWHCNQKCLASTFQFYVVSKSF